MAKRTVFGVFLVEFRGGDAMRILTLIGAVSDLYTGTGIYTPRADPIRLIAFLIG